LLQAAEKSGVLLAVADKLDACLGLGKRGKRNLAVPDADRKCIIVVAHFITFNELDVLIITEPYRKEGSHHDWTS
jgi:hypothetical protein